MRVSSLTPTYRDSGSAVNLEDAKSSLMLTLMRHGEEPFMPAKKPKLPDALKGLPDFEGLAAPQGRAIDVALKLGYDVTPNISVAGGYRILDGGADNDDLYTFARFDSAVLGLTWSFR